MSNETLIGSISEEKSKQLKVYKEQIMNSIGFDLLEEEQKEREEAKLALILMGMSTTIGLTGVGIALNQAFHWMGA